MKLCFEEQFRIRRRQLFSSVKWQSPQALAAFLLSAIFLVAGANEASANASIAIAASASLSADTAGGSYTTLTGPALDEGSKDDVGIGTIVLNAPAGFQFDPAATVTAAVSRISGNGTLLTLASGTATVTASNITISVTATDGNGTKSRITWSGIRVRPAAATPLAVGNITRSGTSSISGISTSSNFGTLTEVGGAVTQLVFTTQPGGATAGAPFATQPVVRTRDQFGNNSSNGLPSVANISLALTSGTGPLQGNTTLNIGMTGGRGTASFSGLRIDVVGDDKQLTVTSTNGLTGAVSAVFTVNPGAANKLILATPPSSSAVAGEPFAQQPVILVSDAYNNIRSNDTSLVTAARDIGSGTLLGTSTVTAVGGVATFTNLAHPVATDITIMFFSGALIPATSGNIAITPGPFSRLQILMPGESSVPGSATGKSGLPLVQFLGLPYNTSVNAVDTYWNLTPASDVIHITCTDASATLPADAALSGGTHAFTVTNKTLGNFTLTASDVTTPSILNVTSSVFTVASPAPVLPSQTNRTINELTSLVVTNTATSARTSTNAASGGNTTTNTIIFNYPDRAALLAGGWDFIARTANGLPRDTEQTNGAVISYDQTAHPGILRIPMDVGDLWQNLNDTRNSLFRDLAPNWISMKLNLSLTLTQNFQQAHLALYQDDDNWVHTGIAFNDTYGGTQIAPIVYEFNAVPNATHVSVSGVTNITMRMDRDPTTSDVTVLFSLNGTNWVTVGSASQSLVNPRLSIWVGGSPGGFPNADLRRLDVVETNTSTPIALTYQLINHPAGASIDANGVVTWTPTEAQGPVTNVFTTVVSDGGQPSFSATNSFTVVVREINTPPQLPPQANRTVIAPTTLIITNGATDTDLPTNTLTYLLLSAPTNAAISTNGVIIWTVGTNEPPGVRAFTTVVTDFNSKAFNAQQLSATNSFTVTVGGITLLFDYNSSSNTIQINFAGAPNASYDLQWAPVILGPWTTLATVFADQNGQVVYSTNGPDSTAFFRVRLQ